MWQRDLVGTHQRCGGPEDTCSRLRRNAGTYHILLTSTAARTSNLVSCMLFSRCVSRDLDASQYVTGDMWKTEQKKKNLTNTEVTSRGVICTPSGAVLRIITLRYFAYLAPQPIASWICRTFLQECTTWYTGTVLRGPQRVKLPIARRRLSRTLYETFHWGRNCDVARRKWKYFEG
jgi:hypothetical protein